LRDRLLELRRILALPPSLAPNLSVRLQGRFDLDGRFLHIPFGNLETMAQAFRPRVLALFLDLGLVERDLLCWRRSGFSVNGELDALKLGEWRV
jgi:hypothetical protein